MLKIAINGLGRIGRSILRATFENAEYARKIKVVAVNGPADASIHSHLLEFDSIHGRFTKSISYTDNSIIIDGNSIPLLRSKDVSSINWKEHDVDIVMECTGSFTSREKALEHIKSGAKKVIISAPAKDKDVKTVVYGVNHNTLLPTDSLVSIGSCTTNCLAPMAKVLHESVGIKNGFMTTIHSYTGDQNNMDGSHKDMRRARACALSIIPTSTGAAKAIGLVLPELAGKLDGSAIRVPTPNVSVVDLCFTSENQTNISAINAAIQKASEGYLKNILYYETKPLVSVDFNHTQYSSIFDSLETRVIDGNFVRVLSWYDNEWAFSLRMLDVGLYWSSL